LPKETQRLFLEPFFYKGVMSLRSCFLLISGLLFFYTHGHVSLATSETTESVPFSISSSLSEQAEAVSGKRTLAVKHYVRGKDVLIECVVDHFSFVKGKKIKKDGEGHIDVYLNGRKVNEISTAAFIVKGLPSGKHAIRLELVHNDSSKYDLFHEFEVNIP
jgi:hypothetical protein